MDLIGIEPMTSSMPWKRAPSCATGPLLERDSSILAEDSVSVNRGSGTFRPRPVSKSPRVSEHSAAGGILSTRFRTARPLELAHRRNPVVP